MHPIFPLMHKNTKTNNLFKNKFPKKFIFRLGKLCYARKTFN